MAPEDREDKDATPETPEGSDATHKGEAGKEAGKEAGEGSGKNAEKNGGKRAREGAGEKPEADREAGEPAATVTPPAPLTVASSPHVRTSESTSRIMWTVFAVLLPASIWSGVNWGMGAVTVLATCTGGAIVFEALAQWVMGREITVRDGSAALTGLLLGLTMPPGASVVICLIGAFVAVVIAKAIFGGLGHNPFNPALTSRVFLLIAFPGPMTRWPVPSSDFANRTQELYGQSTTWLDAAGNTVQHAGKDGQTLAALADKVDAITTATPLAVVKEHWDKGTEQVMQYGDFFLGSMSGSVGEVSGLFLLLGAAVLLWRKYITWHIPVSYLLGVVILAGLTHLADPVRYMDPVFHIFTGGIIIGAFFMATDYVTSPTYPLGMIIFGLGCGLITMVIRLWAGFPEGVSFAILIMNAFVPLIERYTRPKKFGAKPWAEPEASS